MGASTTTLYELETANRALPLVSAIVRDVVSEFRTLRRVGREQRTLRAETDGDVASLETLRRLGQTVDEISLRIEGYMRELDELGLELRDLETGTVDFPTLLNGEPAFFCWRLGEERVEWWHAASSGFADRRPLPAAARATA